jgi:Uma2 family endonuclease
VRVLVALRIRVSPTRVRVPDICVISRDHEIEQVPTKPPLICIEVLSPEDRWPRVEKRIADFLAMGVERVWVFDPKTDEVFEYTRSGRRKVLEDLLEAPPGFDSDFRIDGRTRLAQRLRPVCHGRC